MIPAANNSTFSYMFLTHFLICESKYLCLPLGGSRTTLNSQMALVSKSKFKQANQSIMVKARDVFIMSVQIAGSIDCLLHNEQKYWKISSVI